MLYVIQHGYNYTKRAKPENIIYIAVQLKKIIDNPQLQFFFTDGHSADFLTKFYGKEDINDIIKIIDWEAVKTRKWRGEGIDTDIKRRKQAEFLVNNDIPADYIHGYVCFNETVKKILQNYGIQEHLIKVFPQAYY